VKPLEEELPNFGEAGHLADLRIESTKLEEAASSRRVEG
jgi:hypothetical protein